MLDEKLIEQFNKIDEICDKNSELILNAFRKNNLSEIHFNSTTGYGYNDVGRDTIEKIFADVLGAEDSLVRNQFISGTHALTVAYFALLRPNDTLLSISGLPYDTLHEVIGINENNSSLKSFGVNYKQIDLVNDDFDYNRIIETIKNENIKVVAIQRSKGYSTRKSINLEKIKKVCDIIKKINNEIIIMVDNCYCELVTTETPLHVGADLIVGSLIKNLGGGIAPNGAYIAGRKDLIELCAERLTVPGCGKEVGPSLGINKSFLQGLYLAPNAVASSLKTAILAAYLCEKEGYNVEPRYDEERVDIVQNIIFNDPNKLIKFVQEIQKYSAIDSFVTPVPTDMPGYSDQIIMASGSFTQGSSIEISCDGPIRPPYIAYLQGGLTFNYGKIAVTNAVKALKETE